MLNMTIKEKSTWLSLLATLYIFGRYTFEVFAIDLAAVSELEAIDIVMGNLSSAVLLIIIVEIIFQSIIAMAASKNEVEGDERDKLISLKANNSGYWVLSVGAFLTLGQLLLPHAIGMESSLKSYYPLPLFELHILLFAFILSEVVRFAHQVVLYRKDAV
ncbi:hypothetical protein ISG33_07045 [Glaciecola sp. MH2013]|uniref:hypothetical protein n=1 Tax=Glaciecola sp. MH2013 TaxID=2785524 RepID=UPI00189FDED5|nr:hypothetical protein [Glaciecola sp. MH2013]MBF7073154.1 hypothetical protein [Glaciecola sp. MH2013]